VPSRPGGKPVPWGTLRGCHRSLIAPCHASREGILGEDTMRHWIKGAVLGLALASLAAAPALAQRTKVTIYTSLENDQLGPFKQAIESAVPGAEVVWVRDSTGVITARFLAEKDNPRADMVLGHAAT